MKRIISLVAIALVSSSVHAGVITFDELGLTHGSVVNNQYSGVAISAINITSGDGANFAVAYNSSGTGGEDSDLEGPTWGNSNITGVNTMNFGNVLIIQENHSDGTGVQGCAGGQCLFPDDEGQRRAGSLIFDFDMSIDSFGFDLIDVEGAEASGGFLASFFGSGGGLLGFIGFEQFEPGGAFDQGAVYGDNSVNRIDPIDLSVFGDVKRVELGLGGSGAVDNIKYSVPEPLTIALFGIGLFGLGFARHRIHS